MNDEDQKRFAAGTGLPFSTTDAVLANCLRVAGIPEAPWSPRRIYDADIIFRGGGGTKDGNGKVTRASRYAGMDLITAARKAHADEVRGRIEYHFEHRPETKLLCDAYTDEELKIKTGTGDPGERIREIMRLAAGRLKEGEEVMDEREALVRLGCVLLKLRIEYVNRWKAVVPTLHIAGERTKTTQDLGGGRHRDIYRLGDKFVPINADDATLRKIGVLS